MKDSSGCTVTPHRPANRPGTLPTRPGGHHLCSQPSSAHKPLIFGMTSLANRVMFCFVSSCGIEPICSRAMRLPTFRPRHASISRSVTVSGLPAMTKPCSTSESQSSRAAAAAAISAGEFVLRMNSVLRLVR